MKRVLKHSWSAWCICALVAFQGNSADGQTDHLQWKWASGDRFDVTFSQSTDVITTVESREKTNRGTTTIVMEWEIKSVDNNGDATIEQSLRSIEVSTGNPAVPSQAVYYKTSSDQKISKLSQQLLNQVTPMIGMKFLILMSPQGEIKKITLPPASTEIVNQMPETMRLRSMFNEEGLQEMQGISLIELPAKDLTAGESWSVDQAISTPLGELTQKRTYTFVGEKTIDQRRVAEFSLVTKLEPSTNEADPAQSPQQPNSDDATLRGKVISSTGSGEFLMDIENGFFLSSKIVNQAQTEKPFREKKIETTATSEIMMTVSKAAESSNVQD